ncbi:Ran-specific GTPase-activating protein 30 [Golovinomyces cichoracearum]|uniref:Ran-specific GTPase-activating protein 30 n=1 Tax=Golovinomyces cichoracearum TaxID=62708 RepID=A0A420I6V9_9PEZI|nr:Ran-specific GTPase-activating protein 30 [Golovinomyces cichoracearum]
MEDFLGKLRIFFGQVTQHAMNYAIRSSGIGITASFAISQTSRLLRTISDRTDYQEIHALQERLESKIRIISPAIDLIELISARGNTTLESAVTLTRKLRWDIQSLGVRLEKAASTEEESRKKSERIKSLATHQAEIRQIVNDIKRLIARIEDAVPLINLAITTSGANLSTNLPPSVSPSRLLQASTFLTAGDTQYFMNPGSPVQIGPTFSLSLYMLFAGHSYHSNPDEDSSREMTWKEVIHKGQVKLLRSCINNMYNQKKYDESHSSPSISQPAEECMSPLMAGDGHENEYSYYLEIIEDLDDDRVHSREDGAPPPGPYGGVSMAGIREIFPIYQVGKIFYADTGKILNIGNIEEANSPVLLLKRDINAQPPRRMMPESKTRHQWYEEPEQEGLILEEDLEAQDDVNLQLQRESSVLPSEKDHEAPSAENINWQLPVDLDPEWLAFEVYNETEELDTEDEQECPSVLSSDRPSISYRSFESTNLTEEISCLKITPSHSPSPSQSKQISPVKANWNATAKSTSQSPFGLIRSSLSLLEMLIRLTSLQQFQQASHLSIPDELLTFFLEESSSTGAGGNDEERRRKRHEARRKVGFDPYDESPIKRRGEDYQMKFQGLRHFEGGSSPGENENRNYYLGRSRDYPSTPEPYLLGNKLTSSGSKKNTPDNFPGSPLSSFQCRKKSNVRIEKIQHEGTGPNRQSFGNSSS